MATIKPFAALRPKPELAARICELPYDVMSSEEAREMARGNDLSFLHVSKPEIDLPPQTDIYAPEVYAKGKENFRRLIDEGSLRQDAQPCFYFYRQIMGKHSQIGLVAAASLLPALAGAQGTKLWSVARYDEMEKGSSEGVAIRSDGRLEVGPASSLLYETGKSYVWSMTSDGGGNAYLGLGGTAAGSAVVMKVTPEGKA